MKYLYVENDDIEDFSQQLSFDADAYLIAGGKLQTNRHVFRFPHVTLFSRYENAPMHLVCRNRPETVMLGFPELDMQVNGKLLTADKLFLVAPSEVLYTSVPAEFRAYGICFDWNQALHYIPADILIKLKQQADVIRAGGYQLPFLNQLKPLLARWVGELKLRQDSFTKLESQTWERKIFKAINDLLRPLQQKDIKGRSLPSPRKAIVDRAMSYLADKERVSVTIPELAENCYCSTRSLEYAFKSFCQMSPKQFLNLRRLHLIRQDIKKRKFHTLKALNIHYAISNAGRISAQYQNLFGEYPKETWYRVNN